MGSSRIVQVPIDDALLSELDELSKTQGSSRSETIRTACRDYLRRRRAETLDDAYERGYKRVPEGGAVGEAQATLAAHALPEETW
jgi:metal-responsive CopG/Arc/MetJ family transcriptional regulator